MNVKQSVFLTRHNAIEVIEGVEIQIGAFLTSTTDGGEWFSFTFRYLYPTEKGPL
jgi:hypothetical protein